MNTLQRLAITVLAFTAAAEAASLKQAEFTRVINDVRLLPAPQQALPAKVGDKITGTTAVSTGVASRAELRFPDKTLTRIGSNSVFKLDQADRTLNLEQGVILLQVPKQIGGAKVRTAAVTAAVTGTSCIVERTLDGFIKIIVLEGVVDAYFNNDPSNLITLVAGDILIFKETATEFPQPAKVDLELLKKTSKLMDPTVFDPLINQKQLADALEEQDKLKNDGELLKTAFEIVGRGTQITLTNEARMEIFKTLVLQDRDVGGKDARDKGNSNGISGGSGVTGGSATGGSPASGNAGTGTPGGSGGTTNSGSQPPPAGTPAARPIFNAGTTVFGNGSSIVTNPHVTAYNSAAGAVVTMQGTIYKPSLDGHFNGYMYGDNVQTFPEIDGFLASHGNWFAFKGDDIFIAGDVAVDTANGPRNIALGAVNSVTISQDATNSSFPSVATDPSWTLPPSVDALLISTQNGSITMDSSFSLYGSGGPQDVFLYAYGPTSDVVIGGSIIGDGNYFTFQEGGSAQIYLPEGTFTAHAGQDISLANGATVEAGQVKLNAGRDVNIQQSTVRARTLLQIDAIGSIKIQNSSQLASLPTEVESLSVLLKAGGDIAIGDEFYGYTSVQGARVEAVSTNGNISIHNSSIIADVIKARVMSTGGELLINNAILGRNSPATGSLIKLYGEGASGVRFSGISSLNANNVDIAGKTVTIEPAGQVRLSNPTGTRVFTDTANFNNGTHGEFTNSSGSTPYNPHAPVGMGFEAKPPY